MIEALQRILRLIRPTVDDAIDSARPMMNAIRDRLLDIGDSITHAVRMIVAVVFPLSFLAIGLGIAGVLPGWIIATIFAGVSVLALWLAGIWWTGHILTMDVGEVTLRQVLRNFRRAGRNWPEQVQGAAKAVRNGLRNVVALAMFPALTSGWVWYFDPVDQWWVFAATSFALLFAALGFLTSRSSGGVRFLLFALALGGFIFTGLKAQELNADSWSNQQEAGRTAAALEAAGYVTDPNWCTHLNSTGLTPVEGSQNEGYLKYEIVIQPGCAVQYNRPQGTWWQEWSLLPANQASWYHLDLLSGESGWEGCDWTDFDEGSPPTSPNFILHDGGGVAFLWIWDRNRVQDPTADNPCHP